MSGSSPNSAMMSIAGSTSITILAGSGGVVGGDHRAQAKRESERNRHDLGAGQASDRAEPLGQPCAAGQENLGLLAADADRWNDRHPSIQRGFDVTRAAAEVDDVL